MIRTIRAYGTVHSDGSLHLTKENLVKFEEQVIESLKAALRRHGHNNLCGLLIGDETFCGDCRKAAGQQ